MHARNELCALTVAVVVLEQELAGLFVQCRLGVGIDEQALHREKDVTNPIGGLPVLLKRVHTNLAGRRDVGVEDLRGEPACTS